MYPKILKKDFLRQYDDVSLWLQSLDPEVRDKIIIDAINKTATHFNEPQHHVKYLLGDQLFWYSNEDIPFATFYHEHLRKIRDSHQ